MNVALIGASGSAGSRILNELLSRGHQVLALARHADRIQARPGVTAKSVDANDSNALADAIRGCDGKSAISMEDYAIAMVDELEQGRHIKQRFTVGY